MQCFPHSAFFGNSKTERGREKIRGSEREDVGKKEEEEIKGARGTAGEEG